MKKMIFTIIGIAFLFNITGCSKKSRDISKAQKYTKQLIEKKHMPCKIDRSYFINNFVIETQLKCNNSFFYTQIDTRTWDNIYLSTYSKYK